MGKKIEKPVIAPAKAQKSAPAKASVVDKAAPVAPAKPVAAKKPPAAPAPTVKETPLKAAPAKAAPAPKSKPVAAKKTPPTFEEIQKQAYYVAEKRIASGIPGNSESDWIAAEKELLEGK